MNPGDGANVARIVRTPRTIPTSATDDTPIANPDAFTSATFKEVMHATGNEVFSEGGDEFKVNGYVTIRGSIYSLATVVQTGLKLTNDGLVIRTGGTDANRDLLTGDFADVRKDITTWESDSNNDGIVNAADGIRVWFIFLGQAAATRQALQSRKSAQRLFSRQHLTAGRALVPGCTAPAVRGSSETALDRPLLNPNTSNCNPPSADNQAASEKQT